VADALRAAQERGDVDEAVDVEREAAGLVALVDGLAVQASFDPGCLDVGLVDERLAELRRAPAR
jgi:BetI-type transcriptional repressor, C-terminal